MLHFLERRRNDVGFRNSGGCVRRARISGRFRVRCVCTAVHRPDRIGHVRRRLRTTSDEPHESGGDRGKGDPSHCQTASSTAWAKFLRSSNVDLSSQAERHFSGTVPRMARAYFLAKSEPSTYSFADLEKEGRTRWDGVRNFEARNNIRAMKKGDYALFYHSGDGKEVVGICEVVREAYPDPTSDEDWSAVDVVPIKSFALRVTLAAMKANPKLSLMTLLRKSRLSVVPLTKDEFSEVLRMGKTTVRA